MRRSVVAPDEFRERARRRLPPFLFEYIDGGALTEQTLAANRNDLANVTLRQRVARDVSTIDLGTTLLGERLAMPVGLGPIGLAGMNARRGEAQAARAAKTKQTPFCLSTVSACSLEEVAARASAPWLQVYIMRDRGFLADLIARGRALGCPVLMLTLDMPIPGKRYRDYRSGLAGASGMAGRARRIAQALQHPQWAWDVGVCGRPHTLGNVAPLLNGRTGLEDFFAWMNANFDPTVTWRDVEFVRARWSGKLVVKGLLDPDDARQAAACGADGVVVSNHGGRQLDGAPSTVRALPAIADAIADNVEILADGGVRNGLDVIKMLALGARGVLLGRAWAYALGADGEAGVLRLLELLEAEMRLVLALTGCRAVRDIDASVLA